MLRMIVGLLLLLAFPACAQDDAKAPAPMVTPQPQAGETIAVTLDVQPRTFTVPATLTVTWSTPALQETTCTASGASDWSGLKAPSGSQSVQGALGATVYSLSCQAGVPPVQVSWTHPTTNTNGTTYNNPKHTAVIKADTAAELANYAGVPVAHPKTTHTFTDLPAGTTHFATRAVSLTDQTSELSASVSTTLAALAGTAAPVTVTGSSEPTPPPTGVVSISTEGYAVKANELQLKYLLDGIVGTVQMGAPCDQARKMGETDYYAINRAKYVTWTTNRRPKTVVVQCAAPAASKSVESEAAPLEDGE